MSQTLEFSLLDLNFCFCRLPYKETHGYSRLGCDPEEYAFDPPIDPHLDPLPCAPFLLLIAAYLDEQSQKIRPAR